MTASSLSELLDERKSIRSRAGLEALAKQYSIEVSILECLVRSVNTPSIGEQTTVRSVEDGEEKVKSKVLSNLESLECDRRVVVSSGSLDKSINTLLTLAATYVFKLSTKHPKFAIIVFSPTQIRSKISASKHSIPAGLIIEQLGTSRHPPMIRRQSLNPLGRPNPKRIPLQQLWWLPPVLPVATRCSVSPSSTFVPPLPNFRV